MTVRADLLSNLASTQRLSSNTINAFTASASVVSHKADETIFHQGDTPADLFILVSGRIKLYRQSHDRTQILALLLPGEWFGAESIPTESPCPCSATTLTPTLSMYLSKEALHQLLTDHPDFQETLLEMVAQRLKQFVSLVHDLAFRDVTSRLATVLVTRAQNEGQPTNNGISIDHLLSQQEFAQIVGTAREVINRTFKRFEHAGIVRLTPDHILILDLERLINIAKREIS